MEEGLFPHANSMDTQQDIEEERRLCYVGITRAMDKLYLTRARKRMRFGRGQMNSPSRFLSEIPGSLIATDEDIADFVAEEFDDSKDEDIEETKKLKYKIGDEIIHSKWGKGEIINMKENNGLELTVRFKRGMSKNLLAEYAPIQKV